MGMTGLADRPPGRAAARAAAHLRRHPHVGGERDRHGDDRAARRHQHARRPDHQRHHGYGDTGRLAAAIVVAAPRRHHGASPRRRSARRDARGAEARTRQRVTAHEYSDYRKGSDHMKTTCRRASWPCCFSLTLALVACGDDDDDGEHGAAATEPREPRPRSSRTRTTSRSSHDRLQELHRAEGARRDLRPGAGRRRLHGQEGAEPRRREDRAEGARDGRDQRLPEYTGTALRRSSACSRTRSRRTPQQAYEQAKADFARRASRPAAHAVHSSNEVG